MAKSVKGQMSVSGLQYPLPFLCSQIAKLTGTSKPVKFFPASGSGGKFKADNRTVATYDGAKIRAASDNRVLALPDPPSAPKQTPNTHPKADLADLPSMIDDAFKNLPKPKPEPKDDINDYVGRLLEMYEYDKAMRYIDGILGKDPDNVDAISQRCTILYLQGGDEESINEIRSAMQRMPENTTLAWRLFALQHEQRLYDDAIRSIDEYIRMDENDLSAKLARLDTLIKCGRFSDAMDAVEAEMNVPLQKLAEWYGVGMGVLCECVDWSYPIDGTKPVDMNRFEEMHSVVRDRIIELYKIKSLALGGMRRYGEALDTIDRAIRWEEQSVTDHLRYIRAKIMADAGRKIDALKYYQTHHVDWSASADNHRGILLAEMGKHAEALKYLRRAAEDPPAGDSEDAELAALSLIALGEFEEAEAYADYALKVYPGSKKALEIKEKIRNCRAESAGEPGT